LKTKVVVATTREDETTTTATTTPTTPPPQEEILPTAGITMPASPSHATVLSDITNDDSLSSTRTKNNFQ
jgi:hypothetical protein